MLSRKIFEILHGVMAFLVLFEQNLIKLCASLLGVHQICILFAHFRFMRAHFRREVDLQNFGGRMQF